MVGEIKGYCTLKSLDNVFIGYDEDAFPKVYKEIQERSLQNPLRIIDIGRDNSGFLALEPGGLCLLDIRSMEGVDKYFFCESSGDYILPPNLTYKDKFGYIFKCMNRKGGYDNIIRRMVIFASLHSGKFDDRFLWDKE